MTAADDSPVHQGRRAALVRQLRARGIANEAVLTALGLVPRHLFFDSGLLPQAYQDKAFPIGAGQTISQPYTVAYQSALLAPQPGDRVLEIGTGSGYQACVLVALGAEVHTIELEPSLSARAGRLLARLGASATLYVGDGSVGLPTVAPFSGILVTAGARRVPPALLRQLAVGGRLVVPVGPADGIQRMLRIERESATAFRQETFADFRFVPLRGAEAVAPAPSQSGAETIRSAES
ncbi:MAG: protein-L-isoaspartate(D-aspartate) O-methyltransferase [Hymenobacteraceae bacterium]|nr:protein-L-isoaspartate(D-aspartate) O-methyltransferase [Hymenobacteraceae bacterium]